MCEKTRFSVEENKRELVSYVCDCDYGSMRLLMPKGFSPRLFFFVCLKGENNRNKCNAGVIK